MNKKLKIFGLVEFLIIVMLVVVLIIINFVIDNTNDDVIVNNDNDEQIENVADNPDVSETIVNKSGKLSQKQEVNGFVFENTSIIYKVGVGSILEVKVMNNTDKTYYLNGISAIIKDKDGSKIEVLTTDSYLPLTPNGSCLYTLNSSRDLTQEGYFVEYKLSYQE